MSRQGKYGAGVILRTDAGGWKLTDQFYNKQWVEHALTRIVVSDSGCWLWQGFVFPHTGYGAATYRRKSGNAHRWMYIATHGVTLTKVQYVCHTCDVPRCINPDHLWVGSNSDNQKDAVRKLRHCEKKLTHCHRGHEFTPENTHNRPTPAGGTNRVCKICSRAMRRISKGWPVEKAFAAPSREMNAALAGVIL